MRLVVPVKYVPEPTAIWKFHDDLTLDRESVEGRLSELDEYAVEQAVRLVEAGRITGFTVLTVGPAKATDALRKALAMGGTVGIHVLDEAMHGSDALATSRVIARAVEKIGFDLVLCGMSSTDGEMSVIPAMVAERLAVPHLTFASALTLDTAAAADPTATADPAATAGTVSIRREADLAAMEVRAPLPAVVSVTDQSGEPRYPSFKAIMAARKKTITTWSLQDLDLDTADVGPAAARVHLISLDRRPPRQAGPVIVDDGDAALQLADFLTTRGLL